MGKNMKLRIIKNNEDMIFLFKTAKLRDVLFFSNDIYAGNFGFFCSCFDKLASDYFHDFYLVIKDDRRIGYVATHDYKEEDRHCFIELRLVSNNDIDFKELLLLFLERLHMEYQLNKVFALVIDDFEKKQYEAFGFSKEACLKDYIFTNGKLNTLYIFSYQINKTMSLR